MSSFQSLAQHMHFSKLSLAVPTVARVRSGGGSCGGFIIGGGYYPAWASFCSPKYRS